MKFFITASIPTGHTIQSLRLIGLPITQNPDGSYSISFQCNSIDHARQVLRDRLNQLYNTGKIDFSEYEDNLHNITYYNCLELYSVSAVIEILD